MLARVIANSDLADSNDGAGVLQILDANATLGRDVHIQIANMLSLFDLDTASGDDLDERAKDYNPLVIERRSATQGTGTVFFERVSTVGELIIPSGTELFIVNSSPRVRYFTQNSVTIPAGQTDSTPGAIIKSEKTGAAQNIIANSLSVSGVIGITAITHAAVSNALDKESDDNFRFRIKQLLSSLARCTIGAIEASLVNLEDTASGRIALNVKVIEDDFNLGLSKAFIDDGTSDLDSTAHVVYVAETSVFAGATDEAPDTHVSIPAQFSQKVIPLDALADVEIKVDGLVIAEGTSSNQYEFDRDTGLLKIHTAIGSISAITFSSRQTLFESTLGGESLLILRDRHFPLDASLDPIVILKYDDSLATTTLLTTPAEYILNESSGQLTLTTTLAANDKILMTGRVLTGLLKLASKKIEGDPDDRETYPGLRAAGTKVIVTTPTDIELTVTVSLVVEDGFTLATVQTNVELAIGEYFGSLGVGDDVILTELIKRAKTVAGVFDLTFFSPSANVVIDNSLSAERARLLAVEFS